jgi:GNAT superfamily N-acetyltransferase
MIKTAVGARAEYEMTIRPIAPAGSIAALTELLHRAYAGLAARGMRFLATHQDEDTTARRIAEGECFVAKTSGTPWYDRPDVASFGQFGVEPSWHGRGVGSRLSDVVERRAHDKGVSELALDTAETADELIAYYARRGYRFIEHTCWSEVNYRSVIMSKRLAQ